MKIAQHLLISDKNNFEQLTPEDQQLWTTFETSDIYRFLTGEEDTVPEFQYNWTTGGVKTERVFPGLSVLRKNKKMEVLYPEKQKR